MTRKRVTTLVLGGALLASWLLAAAGPYRQPAPIVVPPPPPPAEIEVLATTVQQRADRLRTRLDRAPAPRELTRNPFSFAVAVSRRRDAPREVVAAAVEARRETASAPARSAPSIVLVGIATDRGMHRAVLTVAGEMAIVTVGDVVAHRYRVAAISADVVELEDDRGGPVVRLGLR